MQRDPETEKILEKNRQIASFVSSPDWRTVKKQLIDKLVLLDSISSIPDAFSPEERLKEVSIRAGVVSLILEWLREIEGTAKSAGPIAETMATEHAEALYQEFK